MARGESLVSPSPIGAGREISWYWPNVTIVSENGQQPDGGIIRRGNIATSVGAQLASTNGNVGWNANTGGVGVRTATIAAVVDGAPNGAKWTMDGMVLRFTPYEPVNDEFGPIIFPDPGPNTSQQEELNYWRVIMIGFYGAPTVTPIGNTIDNGLELTTIGSASPDAAETFRNGTPGVGFRCILTDTVEAFWCASQGGTIHRQTIVSPGQGVSTGGFNAYELQIQGAQGGIPASISWLVNGRRLLTKVYDENFELPYVNSPGGVPTGGLMPSITCNGGFNTGIGCVSLATYGSMTQINDG